MVRTGAGSSTRNGIFYVQGVATPGTWADHVSVLGKFNRDVIWS